MKNDFIKCFGSMSVVRNRDYKVLAQFVPISVDIEDAGNLKRIESDSGLSQGVIQRMSWVKPPEKRHASQRVAHLFMHFESAEAANHAIRNSLYIGGKGCPVRKAIREPQRCAKCQRYGHHNNAGAPHFAKDCQWVHDVCEGCGGNHRLIECPTDLSNGSFCVNCNMPGHTVWDRNCEYFKFQCDKLSTMHKEHEYPYFVTDDISTWESTATAPSSQMRERAPNADGWITVNRKDSNNNNGRRPEQRDITERGRQNRDMATSGRSRPSSRAPATRANRTPLGPGSSQQTITEAFNRVRSRSNSHATIHQPAPPPPNFSWADDTEQHLSQNN
jgi:hypothetical protein